MFLSSTISYCQNHKYFDSLQNILPSLTVKEQIQTVTTIPFDKMNSNASRALKLYKDVLIAAKENSGKENIANLYEKIALSYYYKGDYDLSVQASLAAINNYEKSGNSEKAGTVYANLGYQMKRRDLAKSFEYMRKGVLILQKADNKTALAPAYNNYGVLFEMSDKIDSALFYYHLGLQIVKVLGDSLGIPYSLNNIAGALVIKGQYQEALPFYQEAINIRKSRNDVNGLAENYTAYGDFYFKQDKFKRAIFNYTKAEKLCFDIKYKYLQKVNCEQLAVCFEKILDFKQALFYNQKASALKDDLLNEKTNNTIAQLEIEFETEKRKKEIAEQKTTIAVAEEERKRKVTQLYFSIFVVIVLLILAGLIFKNNLQKKKSNKLLRDKNDEILHQKHIVEEQNNEILSSISYAKRIQTAILPTKKIVKEYLKRSFILYKPKDIVAGDFYWMEQKENKILFAAADCTGHGVPGAMVSVVCNNALNRSVREYRLIDPGEILDKTREIVIQEFEKSEEEVKDGMDIALCSLEGKILKYAGAHNPLWIIRDGKIIETKANKQPIGKFENLESYTTHTFELQNNDSIYVFSDGFVDQFGGEKGKKFKAKAFRTLLLSVQSESMERQRELINEAFENWRGNLEQIDDVCVIGVRV
ncbi:SpoIIE family protein phosphatase [Vicingaceae bacterium]|nr:SpoIIE family protein phosphatase [Vicingaceae bacterium]